MINYTDIYKKIDISKPYNESAEISLSGQDASNSASVNFDNDLFWINFIHVTGRGNNGKVIEDISPRERITAEFKSNYKQKFQGSSNIDLFGLNKLKDIYPVFGWLIPPNSELTVKLQSHLVAGGPYLSFPATFHIDLRGFVVNDDDRAIRNQL